MNNVQNILSLMNMWRRLEYRAREEGDLELALMAQKQADTIAKEIIYGTHDPQ